MFYRISQHASEEMVRRCINESVLDAIMREPQQIVAERDLLVVYQSLVHFEGGRLFLVRVIVNSQVNPFVVVTVYRTSNIKKYWSKS